MASILPFIRPNDGSFDDELTRVMGDAFDAVLKPLRGTSHHTNVYATIASRIIEAARCGERDPVQLRTVGLSALS